MKNKLFTLLTLITLTCRAQTIINIKNDVGPIVAGAYYKDEDNILNPFEGTWLFTEGNVSLKIILAKRINHNNGNISRDYIRGGYEYKVGSQVLANTTNEATEFFIGIARYSLWGNYIVKSNDYPLCPNCASTEYRLNLTFSDPSGRVGGRIGDLILRKMIINGQEALSAQLFCSMAFYDEGSTPPQDDFIVPTRDYILIKQP